MRKMIFAFVLGLLPAPLWALECSRWGSWHFFTKATLEDVEHCLSSGADVKARTHVHILDITSRETSTDLTLLHIAAGWSGAPAVISALIKAGGGVNARNQYGMTPLHVAADYNTDPAIIGALIRAGADSDARSKKGKTPLHLARSPIIIAALVEAGANVNARDKNGNTPLHRWARISAFDRAAPARAIGALLDAGADATLRNKDGKTAFDYAEKRGGLPYGEDVYQRLRKAQNQ